MSSSTVAAIAATPAANNSASLTLDSNSKPTARRRTAVIIEKKVTSDILEDKMVVNGKDLSHTIRGESIVERPKDLLQLKKGLISSSTLSPRRKKPTLKPEKSKWQTVLNIVVKNCLLLAALLWLGRTIWTWNDRIETGNNSPFIALEYEGRISDVEQSLKKTAKMLQVQLEVVDKKIGSEIATVTKEIANQVEEKRVFLEKELKKLEARTDNLDKSLSELKDMGLLSKEEFESFWNELKNSKDSDIHESDVSLDNIRALARDIVEKEIEKHAADGLGRVDYALASSGAKVVSHSEPHGFGKVSSWLSVGKGRNAIHGNAHKMLEPSFGEPGQCFALQGSSGFVEIQLRTAIILEAVTLEHVSKSVAYDRSSAPKDCRVSGWFEVPSDDQSGRTAKMLLLSEFSYDLEKSNAQTFSIEAAEVGVINMVRLDFTSNHGSSAHTCIYRFRVHGHEPSSPAAMALQA
ncbi:SUN domain-containing protein 2-like [Typha latifolia]|uniref:SUN domain-containing protein 2-like n=1 Tax=Typha latifolia TaxID=4733 RepID=UPI003C2D9E39